MANGKSEALRRSDRTVSIPRAGMFREVFGRRDRSTLCDEFLSNRRVRQRGSARTPCYDGCPQLPPASAARATIAGCLRTSKQLRFVAEWNALDADRATSHSAAWSAWVARSRPGARPARPRRTRSGRCSRPWMRLFWLWFVPGHRHRARRARPRSTRSWSASSIALGAQAVWAWFSLRKAARAGT